MNAHDGTICIIIRYTYIYIYDIYVSIYLSLSLSCMDDLPLHHPWLGLGEKFTRFFLVGKITLSQKIVPLNQSIDVSWLGQKKWTPSFRSKAFKRRAGPPWMWMSDVVDWLAPGCAPLTHNGPCWGQAPRVSQKGVIYDAPGSLNLCWFTVRRPHSACSRVMHAQAKRPSSLTAVELLWDLGCVQVEQKLKDSHLSCNVWSLQRHHFGSRCLQKSGDKLYNTAGWRRISNGFRFGCGSKPMRRWKSSFWPRLDSSHNHSYLLYHIIYNMVGGLEHVFIFP